MSENTESKKPSVRDLVYVGKLERGQEILDETGYPVELWEGVDVAGALAATAKAPSISELLADAGVPEHVSTEDLVNRQILFLAWRPQEALLPETGEVTDGFFCLVADVDSQRKMTVFVGGIALTRTLRKISQPFRASIEKRGRTWVFR